MRYLQDFRLRDINDYAEWYGQPHKATELQVLEDYPKSKHLRTSA